MVKKAKAKKPQAKPPAKSAKKPASKTAKPASKAAKTVAAKPVAKPVAVKPAVKPVEAAKPQDAAPAPAQKRVFVPPAKPHGGNFPGRDMGKGGPKPHGGMPKGRIFRHQGR